MSIEVYEDNAALLDATAARLAAQAQAAIAERGAWRVALAGGNTPRGAYERLAAPPYRDSIDWARVEVFWGDERCVPPDAAQSNYRMAREAWLAHVPIPEQQIHRMHGEDEPEAAAAAYAETLRRVFGSEWPVFDTVLLGMGGDGHTASLFPGSSLLDERAAPVASGWVAQQNQQRLSLTLPVLNAARSVIFLVAGADKAAIIGAILCDDNEQYPAALVQTVAPVIWLLDAAAATAL